ncbi:hypothetical protein F5Y04DRAFT_293530 [Hypomontagnella monticulosa]|nr:hypothetical protein F5Y04DRAFT_293530 [Hypomontagnella monticulosa]
MSNNSITAMELDYMGSSMPQELHSMACTTQPALMSLPMEVRHMIYENVMGYSERYWYMQNKLYKLHAPGTNLLLVCKQMRAEIMRLLYRGILVTLEWDCTERWATFFKRINILNMAHIQTFSFHLDCWARPSWCVRNDRYNRWKNLSASLARFDFRPRCVNIIFSPCQDQMSFPSMEEPDHYAFTACEVYGQFEFLKFISSTFGKAARFELDGWINPLFPFSLHQRFGFVITRQQLCRCMYGHLILPRWTLINPDTLDPATDLKGFAKNPKLEGVYDKVEERRNKSIVTW